MSRTSNKGRPAQRRRPASLGSRLMGWVNRVTPWFAVVVIGLAAVWLAFAVYSWVDTLAGADRRTSALWGTLAIYAGALFGAICMAFVAVRAASTSRRWPSDTAVRVLATLATLAGGLSAPLIVLRGDYGIAGIVIALTPIIVYYVRLRRPLMDVLPAWCGGTWRPEQRRRRRPGDEVIKRPPRTWDSTSGPGASRDAGAAGAPRRKQGKKKKRSGR